MREMNPELNKQKESGVGPILKKTKVQCKVGEKNPEFFFLKAVVQKEIVTK